MNQRSSSLSGKMHVGITIQSILFDDEKFDINWWDLERNHQYEKDAGLVDIKDSS
jgi:hypothetical protein